MQDTPSFGGAWGGCAYRSDPQPPNLGGERASNKRRETFPYPRIILRSK